MKNCGNKVKSLSGGIQQCRGFNPPEVGPKTVCQTLFIIIAITFYIAAAEFEGAVAGIVDNRESNSSVQLPQTIFGILGNAQLGTTLDTTHRFRVGISYLKEFGMRERWKNAGLLLYYRYKRDPFLFLIGSFPKKNVLHYPCFLLSDSLGYFRSNIEGAYFELDFKRGRENVWIDWTSGKTMRKREGFLVGFSGELFLGSFLVSHYFLYHHRAHSKSKPADEHINDNGGGLLRLGKHFTQIGFIDTLSFSVDGMASFNRIRHVSSWHTPVGAEASIRMLIRKFGGDAKYYKGIYKDESDWHNIRWGNVFYRAKEFAQFNLYFFPIQSKYVTSEFILSFYIVEHKLDTRQKFLLTMSFDRFLKGGRKR